MPPTGLFIGRATMDIVGLVDAFPAADEKVTARRILMAAGGPALNAAITFAHLGGRALLVSSFGTGPMATAAIAECEGHGVQTFDLMGGRPHEFPTSLVISVAQDASRCIVNSPPDPVSAATAVVPDLGVQPDIVLLDQFEAAAVEQLLPVLQKSGVPIVLDGGGWKPVSARFLSWATIPIVSSRFRPPDLDGAEAMIGFLRRGPHARWAITRGARGVIWDEDEVLGTIAASPVDAVDTLAAGDIFHGAFCFAFARGRGFADALAFAAAIAAESCRFAGPRAWMQ